jgi:hypothetical protein
VTPERRRLRFLGFATLAGAISVTLFVWAFADRLGPVAPILLVIAAFNAWRGVMWVSKATK